MFRLGNNLEHKQGVETTITGEVLSSNIAEGALHDQFASWLGYRDIPMHYMDAMSISVPLVWFIVVVSKRDLHIWTKCCLCGAILAVCKGLLGCMTVVPDSTGWSHCKDRLGEEGVQYFQGAHTLDTRHMHDFVWDVINLELDGLLQGRLRKPLRYCADMVYSGHTYFVTLFSLGLYDLTRKHTRVWGAKMGFATRLFVGTALSCIVAADVACILMNRFHYSMDVFLALLITLLLYTNVAVALSIEWWAEGWAPRSVACPHCNSISSPGQLHEVMIPPCCFPFCAVAEGSYTVLRHSQAPFNTDNPDLCQHEPLTGGCF